MRGTMTKALSDQIRSTRASRLKIFLVLVALVCVVMAVRPAISAYYSSRWLDAVLKELDRAKRKVELTPHQQTLWTDGENEFRRLLEAMRGKRDKLREMYERAAKDAEAGKDYDWVNAEMSKHWYDMMESHGQVVLQWDRFDKALTLEQRKIFRASMRELVVKDWEHFSGRWNRYLTQQSQLTQAMGDRFLRNPTQSDKELAERIFGRMRAIAEAYEKKRKLSVQSVDQIMSDPALPLAGINPLAEANWQGFESALKEIYSLSREYYQSNSMGELFKQNKGRLAAAAFWKQRDLTPPSYNN